MLSSPTHGQVCSLEVGVHTGRRESKDDEREKEVEEEENKEEEEEEN